VAKVTRRFADHWKDSAARLAARLSFRKDSGPHDSRALTKSARLKKRAAPGMPRPRTGRQAPSIKGREKIFGQKVHGSLHKAFDNASFALDGHSVVVRISVTRFCMNPYVR